MCSFKPPDGELCSRPNLHEQDYCSLHFGWDFDPETPLEPNPKFADDFAEVLSQKQGDWRGFVFPRGTVFPRQIDFPVDARQCQCDSMDFDRTVFTQAINLSDSTFRRGLALRGVVFKAQANFDRCRFYGSVDMLNVRFEQGATFHRAEFFGRTIVRANFSGSANFNEAVFREAVQFSGWRNITMSGTAAVAAFTAAATGTAFGGDKPGVGQRVVSAFRATKRQVATWVKGAYRTGRRFHEHIRRTLHSLRQRYATAGPGTRIYRVFEAEGHLERVIFMKPEQASFTQLDLWNVHLSGTNLRGVRFLGVNWWQPKLKRNGLKDEIFIRYSKEGPLRHQHLPALEETCRNVRVSMEEARSFNLASDFYIAEMQAARQQLSPLRRLLFSITALYWLASKYGTSVPRAFSVLALIFVSYMVATLYFDETLRLLPLPSDVSNVALRSLQLLIFQTTDLARETIRPAQQWADTMLRILGLLQIAMLIFAFRARIKRS